MSSATFFVFCFMGFYFLFVFRPYLAGLEYAEGLLLALQSENTSGRLGDPYVVLGIKFELAMCKATIIFPVPFVFWNTYLLSCQFIFIITGGGYYSGVQAPLGAKVCAHTTAIVTTLMCHFFLFPLLCCCLTTPRSLPFLSEQSLGSPTYMDSAGIELSASPTLNFALQNSATVPCLGSLVSSWKKARAFIGVSHGESGSSAAHTGCELWQVDNFQWPGCVTVRLIRN